MMGISTQVVPDKGNVKVSCDLFFFKSQGYLHCEAPEAQYRVPVKTPDSPGIGQWGFVM